MSKNGSYDDYDYDDEFDDDEELDLEGLTFGSERFDPTYWQEPDFLLNDVILFMVNMNRLEVGMTLFVKGNIISGTLISELEYLSYLGNSFTQQARQAMPEMSDEEWEMTQEAFNFVQFAEYGALYNTESDEEVEIPPLRYIHIKDPIIISGSQSIISFQHTKMPYLRLRTTMIDGWLLGRAVSYDDEFGTDDNSSDEIIH